MCGFPRCAAPIALVLVFAFSAGCKRGGAGGGPPPGMATRVIAVPAERRSLNESVSLVGTVLANESVEIKAKVAGIAETIHFEEGQDVEQGQLLVEIDSGQIEANLAQAEANRDLAKSKFERASELAKSRALSAQELDEARASAEASSANVELFKQQLADSKIKAPFSGVLGARNVSPGQVVTVQQVLTTLADLQPVKVELAVPERLLAQAKEGQDVELSVAAYPDEKFKGEVYFISPQVDPLNRTGQVKARVPNEDRRLKPGMFASLDLTLRIKENAVLIPEAAVVPSGEQQSVFIIDAESNAQPRPVKTGYRQGGFVEIVEGLEGGEMVIVEGWQKTRPGGKVTLAPPEAAAPYTAAK